MGRAVGIILVALSLCLAKEPQVYFLQIVGFVPDENGKLKPWYVLLAEVIEDTVRCERSFVPSTEEEFIDFELKTIAYLTPNGGVQISFDSMGKYTKAVNVFPSFLCFLIPPEKFKIEVLGEEKTFRGKELKVLRIYLKNGDYVDLWLEKGNDRLERFFNAYFKAILSKDIPEKERGFYKEMADKFLELGYPRVIKQRYKSDVFNKVMVELGVVERPK